MPLKNRFSAFSLRIVCAIILNSSRFFIASGQPIERYMPPGNGFTPNTSTILKTIQVPVGKYHGTTQISVPIYNINIKGYEYPITLSYNASGIRVDEESGTVGLGWKIDLTGQIIQEVRGDNDLSSNYFNTAPELVNKIPYPTYQMYYNISHFKLCYKPQEDVSFTSPDLGLYRPRSYSARSCLDETTNYSGWLSHSNTQYNNYEHEPDMYHMNVPGGITSAFMLKRDRSALERKPTDSKINFISSTVGAVTSYTWNVVDKDGTKYIFDKSEKTYNEPPTGLSTVSYNWLISEIETVNGEKINFAYTPRTSGHIQNFSGVNEVQDVKGPGLPNPVTTRFGTRQFYTQSLNTITFPAGKIEITYGDRVDVEFEKRIDALNVFSLQNGVYTLIKSFKFEYQYFESTLAPNFLEYGVSNDLGAKRLKLVSVTDGGEIQPLKYRFEYNEESLPRKSAYGRDHWGYYNAKNNNQSFIPSESYRILQWGASQNHSLPGADREPDSLYNQCFTLKKVIYPTGGSSEFSYETNDYDIENSMKFNYSNTYPVPDSRSSLKTKLGGGIRIKNILLKRNQSDLYPLKTSYVYNYFEHLVSSYTNQDTLVKRSYGILPSLPTYSTFSYQPSERISFISKRFSSSVSDVTSSSNGIGYSKVIELNVGMNGEVLKTEEDFYNQPEISYDYNFGKIPGLKNGVCNFNGLPLKSTIYKTINSATKEFKKLSVHESMYHFIRKNEAWAFKYLSGGSNLGFTELGELCLFFYPVILSDEYNVTKTIDSLYDSNKNLYTVNTIDRSYKADSYNFIDSTTTQTSKNEIQKSQLKYPADFPSSSIYSSMVARNILTPVIEDHTYLKNVKISSKYTDFALYNNSNYYPAEKRHSIGNNIPEQDVHFDAYDKNGNVTQLSANKKSNAYRWGYNQQHLITSVTNASDAEIYAQNFEEGEADYEPSLVRVTSNSHTGNYSGMISANSTEVYSQSGKPLIIKPGTARNFTYSGWIYSDGPDAELILMMNKAGETGYFTYINTVQTSDKGKWIYITKTFLVPADVASIRLRVDNNGGGNVWFDDLRIHPSEAEMTTYTYQPLVGVTSKIDDKGKTIFYDYDDSGRLRNVMDNNKNVIQNNRYNYKN